MKPLYEVQGGVSKDVVGSSMLELGIRAELASARNSIKEQMEADGANLRHYEYTVKTLEDTEDMWQRFSMVATIMSDDMIAAVDKHVIDGDELKLP